jgi:hypothetical protein
MAFQQIEHFCFYSQKGDLQEVYMGGYPFPICLFDVVKL